MRKYIHQVYPELMVDWSVSSVLDKLVELSTNGNLLANEMTNWQITYFMREL